jgi:hypothetical protein
VALCRRRTLASCHGILALQTAARLLCLFDRALNLSSTREGLHLMEQVPELNHQIEFTIHSTLSIRTDSINSGYAWNGSIVSNQHVHSGKEMPSAVYSPRYIIPWHRFYNTPRRTKFGSLHAFSLAPQKSTVSAVLPFMATVADIQNGGIPDLI